MFIIQGYEARQEIKEEYAANDSVLAPLSGLIDSDVVILCNLLEGALVGDNAYKHLEPVDVVYPRLSTAVSRLRALGYPIDDRGVAHEATDHPTSVYFITRENARLLHENPESLMAKGRIEFIKRQNRNETQSIKRLIKERGVLGGLKRYCRVAEKVGELEPEIIALLKQVDRGFIPSTGSGES